MADARVIEADTAGGYVVRAPRETDAIGSALRGAFSARPDMPNEMRRSLERLDALSTPARS